jgi:PAS domain-containing protein
VGKGNYEYALPFYHERRPILIDLVNSDDPATAVKYPEIKRDGKTLISEIIIPHFNNGQGSVLWFTASPLYDTHGNVVGAIESIRDITERKRAEEVLNENERRFRGMAERSSDLIFILNEVMSPIYVSLFGTVDYRLRSGRAGRQTPGICSFNDLFGVLS